MVGVCTPILPFKPYYGGDMLYTAERRYVRPNPGKLTGRGLKAKALASGVAYVQCPSSIQDISAGPPPKWRTCFGLL